MGVPMGNLVIEGGRGRQGRGRGCKQHQRRSEPMGVHGGAGSSRAAASRWACRWGIGSSKGAGVGKAAGGGASSTSAEASRWACMGEQGATRRKESDVRALCESGVSIAGDGLRDATTKTEACQVKATAEGVSGAGHVRGGVRCRPRQRGCQVQATAEGVSGAGHGRGGQLQSASARPQAPCHVRPRFLLPHVLIGRGRSAYGRGHPGMGVCSVCAVSGVPRSSPCPYPRRARCKGRWCARSALCQVSHVRPRAPIRAVLGARRQGAASEREAHVAEGGERQAGRLFPWAPSIRPSP